jgi:hypothetical protein
LKRLLLDSLRDDADRMRSPLATAILVKSRAVAIKRNYIVFKKLDVMESFNKPGFAILRDFVALDAGGEDDLLKFAQRYGALGLCVHGKALGHRSQNGQRCFRSDRRYHDGTRESANAWRLYVACAVGILTISTKLHRGEWGTPREWARALRYPPEPAFLPRVHRSMYEQRSLLAALVSDWLDECDTRPHIDWTDSTITLGLMAEGERLLSAIGVQLLSAIMRADWAFCSNCGRLYTPTRRPRKDQFQYCQECKIRGKNKLGQREFRRRHQ